MLVRKVDPKKSTFDIFLGKGWENWVRADVAFSKGGDVVSVKVLNSDNNYPSLQKAMQAYFSRSKK